MNLKNYKYLIQINWSKKSFWGKSYFEEDGTQNYLVFWPMYRYFKRVAGFGRGNYIYFWKSKGLCDENIAAPTTSDYNLNPKLSWWKYCSSYNKWL